MNTTPVSSRHNSVRAAGRSLLFSVCGFLVMFLGSFSLSLSTHAEDELAPVSSETTPIPSATSQNSGDAAPSSPEEDEAAAKLPDIEAKIFPVRVVRRSNSNKIYIVEDTSDRRPVVGRILLLKKEEESFLAFRIIRLYPEKRYLALKRVRKYGSHRYLDDGESFTAIEKLSDLTPPPLTAQDKSDMRELELDNDLRARPYDPDLDTGTSPPPKDDEPNEDEISDTYTIEETRTLDHHTHWLTAGFGYIRNGAPPSLGGSYFFSAGNLRYGLNVGKMVFLKQPHFQDSMTVEAGFYFYKSLGFVTLTDAYTVMSLSGVFRYNLITSKSFGFFFYAGLTQGIVLASTKADATALVVLGSILPALGGGFLFEVGPNWFARMDIGLDSIGLNLVLRF